MFEFKLKSLIKTSVIIQGLNSGVTLIDLGKVWKDIEENMQGIFNPYNVGRMAQHFKFWGDFGDQVCRRGIATIF